MSESAALANTEDRAIVTAGGEQPKWMGVLHQRNEYFKRVQLNGGSTQIVKENKSPINHFAIVEGDNVHTIGPELHCYLLALRFKALDLRNAAQPKTYFEVNSAGAREVMSVVQNHKGGGTCGCLYGGEFLLYDPSTKQFLTFFFCSKSMQARIPTIKDHLNKWVTFEPEIISAIIKGQKQVWNVPKLKVTSMEGTLPDDATVAEAVQRFSSEVSSLYLPPAAPAPTSGVGS